ncbi:DciA family protein [Streptomyces sp. NPDC055681]
MRPSSRGASGTRKAKRRTRTTTPRRDGLEPPRFAAVPQSLMAEGARDLPAGGGSVLDQWPGIAAAVFPALAEHVQAVAFHAESGQLDLRPDPSAYATQLWLVSARIVAAVNETVGTAAVRTVRVLVVGATVVNARDAKQSHDRPETPWRSQRPVAPRNTTAPAMTSTAKRKVCRCGPKEASAVRGASRVQRKTSQRVGDRRTVSTATSSCWSPSPANARASS